jgi:hypothetical protein
MFCENAPLLCLNQYCSTTSDFSISCCNGWCGNNTVISNPQYFQFIPTGPDVVFEIHVDDCFSGGGLQCAILDACPWDNSNVWDCNPELLLVEHDITAFGLYPFETFWLVIDGTNGGICNFTITTCFRNPG